MVIPMGDWMFLSVQHVLFAYAISAVLKLENLSVRQCL